MYNLDEKAGTYLALIAEDPVHNKELVQRLEGDARKIGEALVDGGASADPAVQAAAAGITEWTKAPRKVKAA